MVLQDINVSKVFGLNVNVEKANDVFLFYKHSAR